MSDYTISMSYSEFKRKEKQIEDLQKFKASILECVKYENEPITINMNELRKIAIGLIPQYIKVGDVIDE